MTDLAADLAQAAATDRLLLALDFDGSLAPIVPVPEDARMLPELIGTIADLSASPSVTLVLVSGRAGDSLAHCAEAPSGTRVVGSHGAQWGTIETEGGERHFVSSPLHLSETESQLLADLTRQLEDIAARHEGVHVEYKPAASVLHTRRADSDVAAAAEAALDAGPATLPGVNVLRGKAVTELSVLHTNKGEALKRLIDELDATYAIYAGDDVTDEFAFAALAAADIPTMTIKVGEGASLAPHRVAGPTELAEVLRDLAQHILGHVSQTS
ncbi:trehalose-phosphatase [Bowdeniella nasicola]|uniref:Trehalose 6-phosphate phosphatase n=1 Tax=Bowdeniella nasicola TaxID=208480 RepID=A0A1Q5Q2J1_9ACTO|nr:trehalose-phosphatase [Bowdeniella nasicola]OKL53830.1 trehalose-phosphatase [Bowdeniella nasicola]